jgi:hypothetical protein
MAEMQELIALLRREGTYSGVWFSEQLLKAADHLALIEPVMEENEALRDALERAAERLGAISLLFRGRIPNEELMPYDKWTAEARATLCPKSEKQDG